MKASSQPKTKSGTALNSSLTRGGQQPIQNLRPEAASQRRLYRQIRQSPGQAQAAQMQLLARSYSQSLGQVKAAPHKPAAIQLKLRTPQELESELVKNDRQRGHLGAILDLLSEYNLIPIEKDGDYQIRLGTLQALYNALHEWFETFKEPDLLMVPNAALLKQFYSEVEREHREIIAEVATTDHLPVDVSRLGKEEIEQVQHIWQSLLQDKGNLRIKDDGKGYRGHMLAAFAKLLEGRFGRDLLNDLNTEREGEHMQILVGKSFTEELGPGERKESEAVPRPFGKTKDPSTSLTGAKVSKEAPAYDETHDRFDAASFHDFLVQNEDSEKLMFGEEGRKKGDKTGSYVRVLSEDGFLLGDDDAQILMPDFITLGHELGHAQRILRGASLHSEDMGQMGVDDEVDQILWNNPEELVNIKGVENRLRAEHGLSQRNYHAGDTYTLRFERARAEFGRSVDRFMEDIDPVQKALLEFHDGYMTIRNYFTVKPDYGNPAVVERIHKELASVARDARNPALLWQRASSKVKSDPSRMLVLTSRFVILSPVLPTEFIQNSTLNFVLALVDYSCQRNDWSHFAGIELWVRTHNNLKPLVRVVNAGHLDQFKRVRFKKTYRDLIPQFMKAGLDGSGYLAFIPQPTQADAQTLLTYSRALGDWAVVKGLMQKGHQVMMFEAGLTHEEFETQVDPNREIDVEVEYNTVDPKAWFFKRMHHVYVRKKFGRK